MNQVSETDSITWQEVSCFLCGSSDSRTFFRQGNKGQYRFVKCSNCGMVYLNPRPVLPAKQVSDSQPRDFGVDFWKYWTDKEEREKPDKLKQLQNRDTLKELGRYAKPGLLLEIGVMDSDFIQTAQAFGWDVLWQETDGLIPPAQQPEQEFYTGYIRFSSEQFDAVTIRHTLEHAADPESLLREIHRILKPDGILLIEIPNIKSIDKIHKRILLKNKLIRRKWDDSYIPDKYYAFSPKALKLLVERADFMVLHWKTYSNRKNHLRFIFPFLNLFHLTKMGSKMRFILGKRKQN